MTSVTDYKIRTEDDSIMKSDMWAGERMWESAVAFDFSDEFNGFGVRRPTKQHTCISTCFNEVIANAVDHVIRMEKDSEKKNRVSYIEINMDPDTFGLSVKNDGAPIPIKRWRDPENEDHPENGRWLPEILFTKLFSGANMSQEVRLTGGVNGVGMMVIKALSKKFTLEISNGTEVYRQSCYNGTDLREPKIVKMKSANYVKVEFVLDFQNQMHFESDQLTPSHDECLKIFTNYLRLKTEQISAYCNSCTKHKVRVSFNGKNAICKNAAQLLALLVKPINVQKSDSKKDEDLGEEIPDNDAASEDTDLTDLDAKPESPEEVIKKRLKDMVTFTCTLVEDDVPYDINVAVAIHDGSAKYVEMSVINGLDIVGPHITAIYNQFIAYFKSAFDSLINGTRIKKEKKAVKITKKELAMQKEQQDKKAKKATKDKKDKSEKRSEGDVNKIKNYFSIVIVGQIPNMNFNAQNKRQLCMSAARTKQYVVPEKSLKMAWSLSMAIVVEGTSTKIKNFNATKYVPAKYAGKRLKTMKHPLSLFIPEGDSACGLVKQGIRHANIGGFDYCGTYNIQGVPINARKEVKIIETAEGPKIIPNGKLSGNERINALFGVLGLEINKHYNEFSMKTLNYDRIIIMCDQDTDGVGNICSLLINDIALFWPELIEMGFIYRLQSPVIRIKKVSAKSEETVMKFYTTEEFDTFHSEQKLPRGEVRYYKGLGSNTDVEAEEIFKEFTENLIQYRLDSRANRNFEIYHGANVGGRKEILTTPAREIRTYLEGEDCRTVTCSNHLHTETRDFQIARLLRAIPHIIDGLNPIRRKIIATFYLSANPKFEKIVQIAGTVTKDMHYQHGDKSLCDTIIKMAQTFVGSNIFTFLNRQGQFGTQTLGGADAASPRYIKARLDKEITSIIFNPQDHWLLNFTSIDGEMGEPQYFVPIIPYSILESISLPAVGFAASIWARDAKQVVDAVKSAIDGTFPKSLLPSTHKFRGHITVDDEKETHHGTFEFVDGKEPQLIVTSLPLRVWSGIYAKKLRDKISRISNLIVQNKIIDESHVETSTDVDVVRVVIPLTAEGVDFIKANKSTPENVLREFKLTKTYKKNLNFMDVDDKIIQMKSYEATFKYWFGVRQNMYKLRHDRMCIVLKAQIDMYNNIIRFIENHKSYKISQASKEVAKQILRDNKYVEFNETNINANKCISNEDLHDEIYVNGISYNYLLNLTYGQLLEGPYQKRKEDRDKMIAELDEIYSQDKDDAKNKRCFGATLWLKDLAKFEKYVNDQRKVYPYGEVVID